MAPQVSALRRGLVLPALVSLLAFAFLIGLGVWQWERRAWKEALIARLDEQLAAPPRPLPPLSAWLDLEPAVDEFKRVALRGEFLHEHEALVYSAGSGLRTDVTAPGYWVFTPVRLADGGVVMVNRGYVPENRRNPETRREGRVTGPLELVGLLRWPEPRGSFTPGDDPTRNLWYVKDHIAIASAKGQTAVAPFYVEQEAPPAPGGLPLVGKLRVNLPNNHLQYSLTWFGLALVLAIVFLIWAFRRRAEAR